MKQDSICQPKQTQKQQEKIKKKDGTSVVSKLPVLASLLKAWVTVKFLFLHLTDLFVLTYYVTLFVSYSVKNSIISQ